MRATSVEFLAKACDGILCGNKDTMVTGVKIDSRDCKPGDMFVCIVGENNDGHDYIAAAYVAGCTTFLVSKNIEFADACFIVVDDTRKAMIQMAEAYLNQFKPRKVGVTGSVGKTTTKMLTAAVLGSRFNTVCTQKNYNTDIGNAMTAFQCDETTEAIVFEMGMDGPGQIAGFVEWIKPHAVIITNVGISHLEHFESRDGIADAKLEITNQLTELNALIVNSNSDYLKTHQEIRDRAKNKADFKILGVGSDINYTDLRNDGVSGIQFKINGVDFRLPLLGEHNAIDAALAVACGMFFDVPLKNAARALEQVKSTEKRLKIEDFSGITLIDDSYNASPDSVRAGIDAIVGVHARRRVLVLGDMLELGYETESGHKAVGQYAARKGIDMLLATGNKKDYYRQGVFEAGGSTCIYKGFETLDDVKNYLDGFLKRDDAVLVKGSNSTHVSEIAEYIRNKYK